MNRLHAAVILLLAACAASLAPPAGAQAIWPERPIRMMIGSTPGGPTDVITRIIAEDMRERSASRSS